MQRITNITAVFACLVIGTALLVSNIIGNTAIPQTAKVMEKKVGDLSDKEMAKLYGGVNGQRCVESSYLCPPATTNTCTVGAHDVQGNASPCNSTSVVNAKGGNYYTCAMVSGASNDQHCGTSSIVYCKNQRSCNGTKIRGYAVTYTQPNGQQTTACTPDTASSTWCGFCSNGTGTGDLTDIDGHSSQRCVPD